MIICRKGTYVITRRSHHHMDLWNFWVVESFSKETTVPQNTSVRTFIINLCCSQSKGRIPIPTRMNFWKSSKQSLTPLHFWKIILWILRQKCVCSLWRDCFILYDPTSHEMHVVQQFNMVID